jgi:hypothetical protein
MKNLPAILLSVIVLASAASAQGPESIRNLGTAAFAASDVLPQGGFKAQQYVSVSGYLTLRGSAYVYNGSTYVSISLTGNGNFSGSGVQTGYVTITQHESFFLPQGQNNVFQNVRVSANVPLYRNGRYVGTVTLSGYVPVSGFKSGDWLHLSGSGSLSGSTFIPDEDPKPKR